MQYEMRPMVMDDFEQVTLLWEESEGVGLSGSDTRTAIARYLRRNPGLSVVACDPEGRVMGVILSGHDGIRGYLRHLAVARNRRRLGIGRALVKRVLSQLRSLGIDKCTAFVLADNEEGWRFWDHISWHHRPDLRVLQILLKEQGDDHVEA